MKLEFWKDVKFLLLRMKSEHITLECTLNTPEVAGILTDIKGNNFL